MFVALSLLLTAACLLPAAGKLLGHPKMQTSAGHLGIPWRGYQLIGVAELAAAIGLVAGLHWHLLGLAAATGMAVLLAGAVLTHRRAGDAVRQTAPALLTLAMTAAYLAVALAA